MLFDQKVHFSNFPGMSGPKTIFKPLQNCEICEDEGTIVNFDPNFLIPSDLVHKDRVFSWMYEAGKIGMYKKDLLPAPYVNDIFSGLDGVRNLKEKMQIIMKAWRLYKNGKNDLHQAALEEFSQDLPNMPKSLNICLLMFVGLFVGDERTKELRKMVNYLSVIKSRYPTEYKRFRDDLLASYLSESIGKHIEHIREYTKGFDQFNQVLLYVIRCKIIDDDVQVSSKEFRLVKMFYGSLFEDITANYFIPACINNIDCGRPYDQFKKMDLKKYLTINKAKRQNPFEDNPELVMFIKGVDSVLRNASHHGAFRFSGNKNYIEYRSGDTGNWKTIRYSDYLYKCNEIMMVSMYMLSLQLVLTDDLC